MLDGGYLGIWSGEESPARIDPELIGVDDPDDVEDVRNAVDFEAVGPDAAAVLRLLDERNPGQSLHDVPASSATGFTQAFEKLCRDNGLDATLRSLGRVPHRERVRRAGPGVGQFHLFGVPAIAVTGLPRDRPLWVEATAATESDAADGMWSSIELVVDTGTVAASVGAGVIGVDWARLAFTDADALGVWQQDEPIDGLADVAFWGRSQEEAAQATDAALLTTPGDAGCFGWADLPVPEAIEKARAVLDWVEAQPDRKLMVDFRPHSDHWRVMREVRASTTGSGTVEIGGARVLFTMTGNGDGVFPVFADRDADGRLLSVRIAVGGAG